MEKHFLSVFIELMDMWMRIESDLALIISISSDDKS